MQFVKPISYREAIDKVGSKSPIGAKLSSSEWSDVPVALKERAFFSSRIESARFLQRTKDAIGDFLANNLEVLPDGQSAFATGGRSAFIEQLRQMALKEGMGPLDQATPGGLQDITSEKRLGLIFDTQTQQAADYGYRKQGMDPDVLNEFPAQRFIRVVDVKEPRTSHTQYENQVYLKTDPIWTRINADFGVPWGPWGWGCGHDVEDVDRQEAQDLGLLKRGERIEAPAAEQFNDGLQASTKGLEPDLIEALRKEFGDKISIEGDSIAWNPNAETPIIEPTTSSVEQSKPVSAALDLNVSGSLREMVKTGLAAIDEVHDDGVLPKIPVEPLRTTDFGALRYQQTADGTLTPHSIAIRSSGDWPALTTAHESGHFLDLAAIGEKGKFATLTDHAGMKSVLNAANETEVIQSLRQSLALSGSPDYQAQLTYLLDPREIWARAYAQFIAQRSGNATLSNDLKRLIEYDRRRAWTAEQFKPIETAIETMFKELGWL